MKTNKIITTVLVCLCFTAGSLVRAQEVAEEPTTDGESSKSEIVFTYDASGNRISRNTIVLRVPENTPKEDEKDEASDIDELEAGTDDESLAAANELYEETIAESIISIFPNPTKGILKVEISNLDDKEASMILYTMNGTELQRQEKLKANNKLDLTNQPKGMYMLKIFLNGEQSTWKIIKE